MAMRSDSAAVAETFKKLEFLIRLSHTEEQIQEWCAQVTTYNIRIGVPAKNTYEYVNLVLRGDSLEIMHNGFEVIGTIRENRENIFYLGPTK